MSLSSNAPWLAYYGSTPATIPYPECTMYQMVEDILHTNFPDVAVVPFLLTALSC